MGTTLTNGIYLPNEGEKNCYAGLKTNWETLDQKIADITALQQAVAGALHREIVESLPTTDIDPNTIYMVLSGTSATENVYNEFMYVNNAWELIGTSATDLTNYYTKGDVDGLLLLKANASDLTSHTGDTTIHVTSADKSKWNTVALIKQLRLVNTQVGSSTTIAFANIDDTNGIKVGDKCMDLDAKMFEITAVDTTNQTVTVGTALIDLALDANVVHTSGNETVGGSKTFDSNTYIYNSDNTATTPYLYLKNSKVTKGSTSEIGAQILRFIDKNNNNLCDVESIITSTGSCELRLRSNTLDSNNQNVQTGVTLISSTNGSKRFCPTSDDNVFLGANTLKWARVYSTEYYYGSNNVEFSTKFVTTDTAQTITGNKTFSSINGVEPSSLSLPGDRSARVDISSYFTDTSNGGVNRYTVPANGYIYLNVTDVVSMHLLSQTSNNLTHYADTRGRNSVGQLYALLPVKKDDVFACQWYTTATNVTLTNAFFIPCQGNI